MANLFELEKLLIFIIFFLPGFISLKVHGLLIPSDRRDYSKSVFEIISYSALNFGVLIPLILHSSSKDTNEVVSIIEAVCIFLIFPILWPLIFRWLITKTWLKKYILHPIHRPWDFVLEYEYAVIVHLKNGVKIGGLYTGPDAHTLGGHSSTYPDEEQIYLNYVCKLDENGRFVNITPDTRGIIIFKSEMTAIEFFDYKRGKNEREK